MINKSKGIGRQKLILTEKISNKYFLSIIIVLLRKGIKLCRISNKLMNGLMHIKEDGNDSIKVLGWDRVQTYLCRNTCRIVIRATGTAYLNLY